MLSYIIYEIYRNTFLQCQKSLEHIHKCYNARHCLIQFKTLLRLHYSKAKIHNIYPNTSPACDKCQTSEPILSHSFVLCPKVSSFWFNVFNSISEIINVSLEQEPILIIQGVSEALKNSIAQQKFLPYCIITTNKAVTNVMDRNNRSNL